jgi:hypothetical protein
MAKRGTIILTIEIRETDLFENVAREIQLMVQGLAHVLDCRLEAAREKEDDVYNKQEEEEIVEELEADEGVEPLEE